MKNRSGVLFGSLALLLVACAALGFQWWQRSAQRDAARAQLLQDVAAELAKPRPVPDELGSLLVRLRKEPDATSDRNLLLAAARLERARDHDQQAFDLLAPLVDHGQPTPEESREAVLALQRLFVRTGERGHARQAMVLAERCYAATHAASDLFLAWQTAFRSEAADDRERLCKQLLEQHGDSREARLVQLLLAGDGVTASALDAVAGEFETPPLELELLRATLSVRSDALAARSALERLALAAPAVVAVRHLAACAYIAYLQGATGLAADDIARERRQLDAHLQWLLQNAPEDDARRPSWRLWLDGK